MSRMTPGDVPRNTPVPAIRGGEAGFTENEPDDGQAYETVEGIIAKLEKLRAPFPDHMIEKLPKPMWKGAWDNQRGGNCPECHGYHVLANCIHLDYVGHANTTNRLLEVDPFWEWEPMAYTEQGTPLFCDGGLWIKLTVCGITRIGYGDGKNPKEIIGDAIRNAAMRFGVALDLWSKIDLHAERNPGDGRTPQRREDRPEPERQRGAAGAPTDGSVVATDAPRRAPNQDALDELLDVCNTNGLDPRAVEARYNETLAPPELVKADADDIRNYAAILIAEQEPPGPGLESVSPGDEAGSEAVGSGDTDSEPNSDQPADDRGAGVGEVASADAAPVDPEDTSDVEKKPDDLF